MPELKNPYWEKFSKATALGRKRGIAFLEAGYKNQGERENGKKGSRLYARPEVKARVAEIEIQLHEESLSAVALTRESVIRGLMDTIEKGSQAVPVLDRDGSPTGTWKAELAVVKSCWEALGKELGMFRDRLDIHNLDSELADMTPDQVRTYARSLCTEIGVRVVDQSDDELRAFFYRNAPRVGLRVSEAGGADPGGAEDAQAGAVPAVSEATGVPRTRH